MDINKDILIKLALDLDIPDLISLCRTNKSINNKICNNNNFWRIKLNKEYPNTIGLFQNVDYRKIYNSIINKKKNIYYTFQIYENGTFKILDELYKENDITDDDLDKIFFSVIGDFPKGTKIWVSFLQSNIEISHENKGFLSKEEAINNILKIIKDVLVDSYKNKDLIEEIKGKTIKEILGYDNVNELIEFYRNEFYTKGIVLIPDLDGYDEDYTFTIKELTL